MSVRRLIFLGVDYQLRCSDLHRIYETIVMKISIAELLAIFAFVALTMGGLTTIASISWLATSINLVAVLAFTVSAIVAVGPHRAFAISFLVPVIIYWGIVLTISNNELGIFSGKLPTSQLFQDYFLRPSYQTGALSGTDVQQRRDHAESLMPCGHMAVSVALGYLAGKYGQLSTRRPASDEVQSEINRTMIESCLLLARVDSVSHMDSPKAGKAKSLRRKIERLGFLTLGA